MDEPIPCPTCGPVVPTERTTCPTCGQSLFAQKLEHLSRKISEIAANAPRTPPKGEWLGTVNGVGMTLLRYRERSPGIYAATRWFTVAGIPLVPTKTMVVRPVDLVAGISRRTYNFEVIDREPLDWREVAVTWLLEVVMIAPPLYLFTHMREMNARMGDGLAILLNLASLALSVFLLMRLHNADRVYKQRPDPQP